MSKNPIRNSRRKFLKNGGITALSFVVGMDLLKANNLPKNIFPSSQKKSILFGLPGKHPEMAVLNDRPINAEAPPHLLDEPLTSGNRFFVRNNGIPQKKR